MASRCHAVHAINAGRLPLYSEKFVLVRTAGADFSPFDANARRASVFRGDVMFKTTTRWANITGGLRRVDHYRASGAGAARRQQDVLSSADDPTPTVRRALERTFQLQNMNAVRLSLVGQVCFEYEKAYSGVTGNQRFGWDCRYTEWGSQICLTCSSLYQV